jgi:hypothetical protein
MSNTNQDERVDENNVARCLELTERHEAAQRERDSRALQAMIERQD